MKPQLVYPVIPVEVLDLNEDINALEQARKLLDRIDPANVHTDTDQGYKTLRKAKAYVSACHRYAWDKMRQQYLNPERRKIERRKKQSV